MDSYWDLYVAYVHHCVEYNKKYDIDPHHYEMEWNHFLPQCIFGDQPIGHYLLLKHHAIATALQTLAFKKNCLCGWHKKYLPTTLINLAWTYYCREAKQANRKGRLTLERKELGVYDPEVRQKATEKALLPEARQKKKRAYERIKHQQGASNSQYGTIWITNGYSNQKLKKNQLMPEGYWQGRTL